jgi:hypothetical protein
MAAMEQKDWGYIMLGILIGALLMGLFIILLRS